MYHGIFHDRARKAIVKKDNVLERPELDARNSNNRPKTFEEVVTELYNDFSITFQSKVFLGLSHEFAFPIELKFYKIPGGQITRQEVKSSVADACVKIISVSHRISFNGLEVGMDAKVLCLSRVMLFEQITADWEKSDDRCVQRNCLDDKDYWNLLTSICNCKKATTE